VSECHTERGDHAHEHDREHVHSDSEPQRNTFSPLGGKDIPVQESKVLLAELFRSPIGPDSRRAGYRLAKQAQDGALGGAFDPNCFLDGGNGTTEQPYRDYQKHWEDENYPVDGHH